MLWTTLIFCPSHCNVFNVFLFSFLVFATEISLGTFMWHFCAMYSLRHEFTAYWYIAAQLHLHIFFVLPCADIFRMTVLQCMYCSCRVGIPLYGMNFSLGEATHLVQKSETVFGEVEPRLFLFTPLSPELFALLFYVLVHQMMVCN